jgi:hypothetical protein
MTTDERVRVGLVGYKLDLSVRRLERGKETTINKR